MAEEAGIFARESIYLDRYVQIGVVANRLINVAFPTAPAEDATDDHPILDAIDRYLDGTRERFDAVELALTVNTDHRAVYDTVRSIPYGVQRDVETITRTTPGLDASEEADRITVREALAANPVPLVIPDHRVIDGPGGAPSAVRERLRDLEGLTRDS